MVDLLLWSHRTVHSFIVLVWFCVCYLDCVTSIALWCPLILSQFYPFFINVVIIFSVLKLPSDSFYIFYFFTEAFYFFAETFCFLKTFVSSMFVIVHWIGFMKAAFKLFSYNSNIPDILVLVSVDCLFFPIQFEICFLVKSYFQLKPRYLVHYVMKFWILF